MAKSGTAAVSAYLKALPPERRAALTAVRRVVKRHLPAGYRESVNFGMIVYEVPLERYPDTYNRQPLAYVGLAAQKNHCALYLMGAYADPAVAAQLEAGYAAHGLKLRMGKSCVRFTTVEELPLDAIGAAIAAIPVERMIALAAKSRATGRRSRA